ncbi:MAG TPA: DUF4129 domain-containing protein [Puia sp.]|nr:DUF4129 domain-containing protein [Puia sp.]
MHHTKSLFLKKTSLFFLLVIINCVTGKAQSADTATLSDTIKAGTYSGENADGGNNSSINESSIPEPVSMRAVPDTIVENLKKSKDFEYANDAAYLAKEPLNSRSPGDRFWNVLTGKAAQVFVYILLTGVLLFAFYKIIAANKLYLFYSKPKKAVAAQKEESEDEMPENVDEKIKETLLEKNYRLAVRFMHIKALQLLDENELIRFTPRGTNHDYASALKGTAFAKNFQQLTTIYEYVWFGNFTLTQEQAEIVRQDFNRFYSLLNK